MAEKKISQLTAKGATVADTDLLVVSEAAGGGSYTTKSITGANVKALVTDANLTTSDITTNNVSTTKHGFAPKLPGNTTTFLRGDGTYATPAAGGLTEFTEAENTAAPNATVPVNSLTPVTATTNADFAIAPKGTGSLLTSIPDNTATGGNKRGTNAIDLQTVRSSATQVASGLNSIVVGTKNTAGNYATAVGELNTASGSQSHAFGFNNISSGTLCASAGTDNASTNLRAFTFGYSNSATGVNSHAYGYANTSSNAGFAIGGANTSSGTGVALGFSNVSNSDYSHVEGYFAHSFGIIGRQVYASGRESTTGDSQASKFILRERTTGNTATTLTTDSGTAGTTNQVILSNQSAYRFKGTIVGKQSGSVNAAVWDVDGFIVRGANAAATTLNVSNVTLVQNTPAWGTPTLAADTTNGGLRVQVTGAAATNIQWTCTIETTEVIYA
jgi:hypothetical protein